MTAPRSTPWGLQAPGSRLHAMLCSEAKSPRKESSCSVPSAALCVGMPPSRMHAMCCVQKSRCPTKMCPAVSAERLFFFGCMAQAEWGKWRKQCERDGRPQVSMADVAAVRKRLEEAATCALRPCPEPISVAM